MSVSTILGGEKSMRGTRVKRERNRRGGEERKPESAPRAK
jgi:hypothetical protein